MKCLQCQKVELTNPRAHYCGDKCRMAYKRSLPEQSPEQIQPEQPEHEQKEPEQDLPEQPPKQPEQELIVEDIVTGKKVETLAEQLAKLKDCPKMKEEGDFCLHCKEPVSKIICICLKCTNIGKTHRGLGLKHSI